MTEQRIGKVFVELDLDPSRYTKAQQTLLKEAQTASTTLEKNFSNLGIKSGATYDLIRSQAQKSYEAIVNSSKSNDIIRAEEAKNAKLKSLNEQQFGHQTTLIESMKKNWMALSAVAISAYYFLNKFYDLAERGAKVKAVEEGFTSMARSFNVSGDALIKKMEEITKNTIDNSDLMAKALRLISEGFSESQIIGISEAARVSARLTGKTVSEAYDQISDSLINLRERGLKTAGIIVDMDKAETEHAKTLGVAKEQLSDYGKRMAWAGAIMEKTKEDAAKLGSSLDKLNDYEQFQKRTAIWKEFGDQVGKVAGFFVNLASAIVSVNLAWNKFITQKWESEIKRARGGLESMGILSPGPSQYFLSEKMTAGIGAARGGPSQIKIADPLEVQKKLNELQEKGLSIGYQTFEQKIKILGIERDLAIQELKKHGMGQLASKVWENYRKSVEEVEKVEKDRLSGLEVAFGKIKTEAENLSEIGKMPDWRESLDFIEKGWIRINGELRQSGAYIPIDQLGRLDVAMQAIIYDVERLSEIGKMPDWRESLEKQIPPGYMEIGGKLQKIYDPKAVKEMELEVAKITYDYEGQYQIGLKLLEIQAEQYRQLGFSDKIIEKWKNAKTFQLNVELGRTVDLTKSIGTAFDKVFDGMIAGTLKAKDAFKSFFLSIGRDYINVFLKNTREGLEKWLNNLFKSTGETQATTAAGSGGTSSGSGGGGGILGFLGLGGGGGTGTFGSILGGAAAVYSIASIFTGGAAKGASGKSLGATVGSVAGYLVGSYLGGLGAAAIGTWAGTTAMSLGASYATGASMATLGASLGSYLPIIGTIAGALIGWALGSLLGGGGEAAKRRAIASIQRHKTYASMMVMGFDIPLNEKGTGFDLSAIKEQGGLLGIPTPHVGKKRTDLWEAAQELYKSVTEDFAKALSAGLRIDSFKTFERSLRNSIYENVFEGMVQAFTRVAALRNVLTPIYQYVYEGVANALTKGFDIAAFKTGIEERMAKLTPIFQAMEPLFEALYSATKGLRGEITGGGGRLSIPSFQHGGVMPYTGLALVHKGENVGMQPVTVNINNSSFDGNTNLDILSYRIGRKIQWATKRPQVFG